MSSTFDGLSLTNSRDITCNNIYLKYNNDIKNIFDIFATQNNITDITGLPPETLNSLQELANALNNNPDFFNYVQQQLNLKRNISDSYDKNYINSLITSYYTKNQADNLLDNKLNSSEIVKYYTITQTSNLFVEASEYNYKVAQMSLAINLKVNGSDLIEYYYNKLTTNSILESYYNKTTIDNTFSQYYNKTYIDTTLDNYYDKTYDDMTLSLLYSNINSKANITELDNFYTKSTTNSLLDNYYNKGYIDTAFSKYYNITGVNSLLINKVDNATLNNYYDKTYINNSLSNFYQKYQVDGLLDDYYTLTTTNALYASAGTVLGLSENVVNITTDVLNVKTTLPSFLQVSSFNNTVGSYLTTSNFNNTISSYLPIATYNNTILTRLNTDASNIANLNTSVGNINNTLPSFLQNSFFNTTIGSYLTTSNFNNTIGSYLTTTAFNTTLTSRLTGKLDKNIFTIPNVSNAWIFLGSINPASQNGAICVIEIFSNNFYSGNMEDEIRATIQFTTSNGTAFNIYGNDGNPFYGAATMITSNTFTNFVIQQANPTQYNLYYLTGNYPGQSLFSVKSYNTFIYSGTQISPSGCYITPTLVYKTGVNSAGYANMNISSINSNFVQADRLYLNNGKMYQANYTSYNSLVMSHDFGIHFAIGSNSPPLESEIAMKMYSDNMSVKLPLTLESSLVGEQATFLGNVSFPNAICNNNITCNSIFLTSPNASINGSQFKLVSTTANGIQTYCSNNSLLTDFNNLSITSRRNSLLLYDAVDTHLKIHNNGTVSPTLSSSIYLQSNTMTSQLKNTISNFSILCNNNTGLQVYNTGVLRVMNNNVQNKMLVLFEQNITESPVTGTNFFGFGINTGALRYQVPANYESHKFYCGTVLSYTITNGGGASGSDIRFKSEIQDITNALDKVKQLQGKTFLLHKNKRQMGLIAQEVLNVVPEVVNVDTDTEDNYMYLQYDKLVALLIEGIKELAVKNTLLEQRVELLENKI